MNKGFFLFASVCILFILSSSAMAEDPLDAASIDLLYEKDDDEEEEAAAWFKREEKEIEEDEWGIVQPLGFQFNVGVQQVSGFISSFKPFSQISSKASFRPTKQFSFSFNQKVRHNYFLSPRSKDSGFRVQDGIFAAEAYFKDLFLNNSRLKVELSSSLPFSYDSKLKGLWTLSSVRLNWSIKLNQFVGLPTTNSSVSVSAFIVPTVRYYFSRWTTSPTSVRRRGLQGMREIRQSKGGTPLPRFLFGAQKMGLSLSFREQFFLSGGYGRWLVFSHKIKYGRDEFSPFKGYWQRHYYLFFLKGSVRLKKQWNLSLSYSLLNRLNKKGRIETVLFDNRLSSWAVSLSYGFSYSP